MLFTDLIFPSCRRSFWILCCCLLLTNEFNVHAMTKPHPRRKFALGPIRNKPMTVQEKELVSCPEGHVPDGDQCTCPLPADEACHGDTGGMVCDKFGNTYSSLCHLVVQLCRGEISMAHDVSSCGPCSKIRLMNSAVLHLSSVYGLKTFSISLKGKNLEYKSDDNSNLRIYFEKKLNRWIIGEKRGQEDMLLAQFVDPSTFVQDSQKGAYVVRQNLTQSQQSDAASGSLVDFNEIFNFDPHLHLECVNEIGTKERTGQLPEKQAFGFLVALVVVSVVAAATSTTLAIVQKAKGCLYYPSVCDMRDEIKNTLKPKLQQLTHDFQLKFGTGDSFKNTLSEVKFAVKDIQANIALINKLLKDINMNWQDSFSKANSITGLISNQANDGLAEIAQFDEMAKQSVISESIGLGLTIIDAGFTSAAAIAGTMSTAAAAFSVALSVVGIAMAAVTIAISVNEERKLRDKLRTSKSELESSISNIQNAEKTMADIQKNLNTKLVTPLKNFAKKVYDVNRNNLFNNLQKFLTLDYSIKLPFFNHVFKISGANKIKLDWLAQLVSHLEKVVTYTQDEINQLRDLFGEQEKMLHFLDTIKTEVENFKSPLRIYTGLSNANVPKLLKGKFSSLSALMHYISKDILPSSSCFNGYDLDSARKCESCFEQDKICDVPQLSNDKKKIQTLVAQMKPICLFEQDLGSDVFDNTFKVAKYVATFVLPSTVCYWGYNLAEIRANRISTIEIKKAKIDQSLFRRISFYNSKHDILSTVRSELCADASVCNHKWQNLLFCVGNKNYATGVGLHCSEFYNNCETEIKQRFRCPRV